MEDLTINKIEHKIKGNLDTELLKKYIENKLNIKIEGQLRKLDFFHYENSDSIEVIAISTKEDRLKEIEFKKK